MLRLLEFYFDKTERHPYLAQMQGSYLIRELYDQINRKAIGTTLGKCPREPKDRQFVGLVGHDTNLASVGALLNLGWRFDDSRLPPDTLHLPPNDALPAGALVFELRKLKNSQPQAGYLVRISYVTQGLQQMRGYQDGVYRLRVQAADSQSPDPCNGSNPCDIPLDAFNTLVKNALGQSNPFLSTCTKDLVYQICQQPGPAGPLKKRAQ
jgi:hypothetical protein